MMEGTRLARAGRLLGERKAEEGKPEVPALDALLVTSLHNVRYLTGFTGSNGMVLVYGDGSAVLFSDPRYTVQAGQQAGGRGGCRVKIAKGPLGKAVLKELARAGGGRVGFEQDRLTVGQFEGLKKDLPGRWQLEPAAGLVEGLRMVKDAGEVAAIRASVAGNSGALEAALKRLKVGMTEAEFAAEIDYRNRRLGAEGPAFDTIVAAGERAALPHAHPGPAKIGPGMLLIDMGAFREGYASDMTRMVHVGAAPGRYRKAYAAVLEAQLAAVDAIRPGVTTASVDRVARRTLKAHGLDKEFVHSTGHGLGLEIHEGPRIGKKDKTKLAAGMAITIEPGVYVEGWGGIRIEDTVLVTAGGCEVLTGVSKELREV